MRIRVSLPEEFAWLKDLSSSLRSRILKKLLEEKFKGLSPEQAVAEAYRYAKVQNKEKTANITERLSEEQSQGEVKAHESFLL